MSVPKFPTRADINKLSREEVERRLREDHSIEPTPPHCMAEEDEDGHMERDPFTQELSPCPCEEYALSANRSRLYYAAYDRWAESLDEKGLAKELRAAKITLTSWKKRTFKASDLRKKLLEGIEYK